MKKVFVFVLLIIMFSFLNAADKVLVRVYTDSQEIRNIGNEDIVLINNDYFDIVLERDRVAEFSSRYKVEILVNEDPLEELRKKDNFGAFHTYEEIKSEIFLLEEEYPEILKVYDIGDSWEKTVGQADRDIWAVKISDNVEIDEDEPEVMFNGLHHAREIITPEIMMYLINDLVQGYSNNNVEKKFYVENREIWIIPMVNPDGHNVVVNEDSWWRKNTKDNNDNGYLDDYDGIDLNRNYGYMWGYDDSGSSPYPSSMTYRGEEPFSEPETQALRDFAMEHNIVYSIAFHSYSNLYLYPWGYNGALTDDDAFLSRAADSLSKYNGYVTGVASDAIGYCANGDYCDWYYGDDSKPKTFAYTAEVGEEFHPDESEIDELIQENLHGCYYLLKNADNRYFDKPDLVSKINDFEPTDSEVVFSIEFNENTVISSGKVFYKIEGEDEFIEINLSTEDGVSFEGVFPSLENEKTYEYYIEVEKDDKVYNYPQFYPHELFSFSVYYDNTAPIIEHTNLTEYGLFNGNLKISAVVYDNIGIEEVQLIYKINNGSENTKIMDNVQSTVYTYEFTETLNIGDIVNYKLKAVDSSSNSNYSYSPEEGYHEILIVEKKSILLVDDDTISGSNDPCSYFSEALDEIGIEYEVFDAQAESPDFDKLNEYICVIWEIGSEYKGDNSQITIEDQNNLQQFLDNGGKLLLTGDGLMYDLDCSVNSFPRDYLGLNGYSEDTYSESVTGISGTIGEDFTQISLSGGTGYNNQQYGSGISGVNGNAVINFEYDSSNIAGIEIENGLYKAVVLAFCYESIASDEVRISLMSNILEYFGMISTDINESNDNINTVYSGKISPNPFNPQGVFTFETKKKISDASLKIYNVNGQLERIIFENKTILPNKENKYELNLDTSSGIYFVVLQEGKDIRFKEKFLLIK